MSSDILVKQYCKELRLGKNIYENYSKIEAENHADFLAQLLKLEIDNREVTRKNRNLKAAGFDVIKTFEGYSFNHIQIPKALDIELLKMAGFIGNKENLILYGPVGTGKTHLATAIGVAACSNGKRVRFFRTASLVNQLTEAKSKGELKRFMRQIEKTDLLICDEWGYIPFEKEGSINFGFVSTPMNSMLSEIRKFAQNNKFLEIFSKNSKFVSNISSYLLYFQSIYREAVHS